MYEAVLFAHLLGAFALVAGTAIAAAGFETARRRDSAAQVASLLALARLGVPLVAAGGLLAGVCGLWLVSLGGFHFGQRWVQAAIALYVLALALGAAGGRGPRLARVHAHELAKSGRAIDDRLRSLLDDRASRAANYASLALMVAIISLMVFK